LIVVALGIAAGITSGQLRGQIESVEAPPAAASWVSRGRIEGHLALNYSAAGAFSPNSSTLAVATGDKIALMDLRNAEVRKVLRPRLQDVTDLLIQSANFLDPGHLFLLGTGLLHVKGEKAAGPTPLLAFQWDTDRDALSGKVNVVGPGGGFGPARYFPLLHYLGLYKESHFSLWNPVSGESPHISLPALTRQPGIFEFSPDGHWLLLAQIESSSTGDPVVVRLSEHQFVDALRGHQGTVLSIAFSRDSKKVVTACEDGKVRIWSAPDWKLLATLAGHFGPVHRAEFSADGRWVASAGEDKTVRIWSVEGGKLEQTLGESQAPVLSVAFSPDDEFLAASTEQAVLVWGRK
jgi:WD40 repeat protein